jgi:hypothetical protein
LEKDKGTYHYIQEVFVTEEKLESLKGCSFDEIGGFVFEPVMKQIQSVQIKTSNAMRASETNTYKKAA